MKKIKVPVELTATDKASAAIKNFVTRTQRVTVPIERIGSYAGGALKTLGAIGAVGAAASVGVMRMVKGYTEEASNIHNLSKQLGMSAEGLQSLQYAADITDVGVDTLNGSLEKFSRNLGKARMGAGPLAATLKKVWPEVLGQLQRSGSTEEALDIMFRAIDRIKDPAKRSALAVAAFGGAGMRMTRMLEDGVEGLKAMRAEAVKLGLISDKQAADAEAFGDALTKVGWALKGVGYTIGAELVPVLQPLADRFREWITENRPEIIKRIQGAVEKVGEALESMGRWFDEHGGEVWDDFLWGVDTAVDTLGFIHDHFEAILTTVKVLVGVWIAGKLVSGISSVLTLVQQLDAAWRALPGGGKAPGGGLPPIIQPEGAVSPVIGGRFKKLVQATKQVPVYAAPLVVAGAGLGAAYLLNDPAYQARGDLEREAANRGMSPWDIARENQGRMITGGAPGGTVRVEITAKDLPAGMRAEIKDVQGPGLFASMKLAYRMGQ